MSFPKKNIFPENKLSLHNLTPTYSKIKFQPLTETSQQTNAYFLKQNLGQNSNFLKNFKTKHLYSTTPMVNSFIDQSIEIPINPFQLNETQELTTHASKEIISGKNIKETKNKQQDVDKSDNSNAFSFDMVESFEERTSNKVINKLSTPFYKSFSPLKGQQKEKLEKKSDKNMHGSLKMGENKENKRINESSKINQDAKNSKIKLNFRKRSEVLENNKFEKEEFSASKNLLHSSRIKKPNKEKDEENEESIDERKIRNLEIELANEKSKNAEFQQTNDELTFDIKNLNGEIERMQTLLNEKDAHFNELITVKEQYKRKLDVNSEYSEHLKNVNLKLIDQINALIKAKMIGKTV